MSTATQIRRPPSQSFVSLDHYSLAAKSIFSPGSDDRAARRTGRGTEAAVSLLSVKPAAADIVESKVGTFL